MDTLLMVIILITLIYILLVCLSIRDKVSSIGFLLTYLISKDFKVDELKDVINKNMGDE